MKLLTHNFLSSRFLRNVEKGYPLILRATSKEMKNVELNPSFLKSIIPKVEYEVLLNAARAIGEAEGLPPNLSEQWADSEDIMRSLHRVLVQVEVVEGELECPESGHVFPIKDGIPNMLTDESEVAP